MSSSMLEAIVRIRTHLYFKEKCCKDFVATKRMLELFNSKNMYNGNNATDNSSAVDEDELLF